MKAENDVIYKDDLKYQYQVRNLEDAEKEFVEAKAKFESAKRRLEACKKAVDMYPEEPGLVSVREVKIKQ